MNKKNQKAGVLHIERNPVNRKLVASLVGLAGYDITAINDISELSTDDIRSFALIICEMERDSRFEIKRLDGLPPVLWIIDENDNFEIGPYDIVAIKPVTPPVLARKIDDMLRKTSGRGELTGLYDDPEDIMQFAFDFCNEHIRTTGNKPFTAVIAHRKKIIAAAQDRTAETGNPLDKAALLAISDACKAIGDASLADCDIYLTAEPCALSLAAIYDAGLERIFYASSLEQLERHGFNHFDVYEEISKYAAQRTIPAEPLLEKEGARLLSEWTSLVHRSFDAA